MIFKKRPKQGHLVTIPRREIKQIHIQQLTISYIDRGVLAGAVSKEIDRLRLLIEACTCTVCYAQLVSVEACTNMYTHTHTQTCAQTIETGLKTYTIYSSSCIQLHNICIVTTHQDHVHCIFDYYCNFNTIIHNNNTTQFDE